MHFSKLSRGELLAVVGAAALAIGVFLVWHRTGNANTVLDGHRGGGLSYTGWQTHRILRYLLLAAAAAPLILAWIVLRDHQLGWPRGEMTAVVGIVAFGLVAYVGLVSPPGNPRSQVSLGAGWYVAILGTVLEIVGAALRSSVTDRPRKPPGVL
jgi:hypothetical protein